MSRKLRAAVISLFGVLGLSLLFTGCNRSYVSWHYEVINGQDCLVWQNVNKSDDPPSGIYCQLKNSPVSIPNNQSF